MARFMDKTLQDGYDIGRKEVAREIFEEIEDVLKIIKIPCVSAEGYITPLQAGYWAIDPNDYAKLKKKHMEKYDGNSN